MARPPSLIAGIKAAVGETIADWDRFWFTPQDASTLGVIRILSGCLLIYTHLVWSLEFDAFFSNYGWQDQNLVHAIAPGTASCSFWWIVPEPWRFPVHCLSLMILACYTVGLGLRLTSALALIITVSYAHRVPQATFGLDQINTLLTAYLALAYVCLSPWDAACSLDHRLARRFARRKSVDMIPRPRAVVCVATRLIQVHLCILYLSSGLSKLKGETWWEGTAIWLAVVNLEYQTGDLTWLASMPGIVNLATVGTVAFEMLFPILIWSPRFRPVLIVAGLLLHFAIGRFLGMWTFGMAMQICYLSFLPPRLLPAMTSRCCRPIADSAPASPDCILSSSREAVSSKT